MLMRSTINRTTLLQRMPLFAMLTDEQLALLAANTGTHTFKRGEMIFHQDSIGSTLYLIISGRVRIYTVSEMGQEVAVTLFSTGDFFGELALLDGQPRSASAVAMTATTTLTLQRAAFLNAVQACPPIASAALTALSARLRRSTVQTEHLASLSVAQRVVQQLLRLVANHSEHSNTSVTTLHVTQNELASLSGTTRETVNRVLSQLRDQGIVQIERARIIVLDAMQLEQAAM